MLKPFGKALPVSLAEVQDDLNRLLARVYHAGIATAPFDGQDWAPVVDVVDEPSRYILTAEVPGLNAEEVEVCFEQGVLLLKGRKAGENIDAPQCSYRLRERRFGHFCRRILLPEPVNAEAITAVCRAGLLEVVLPKKEPPLRKVVPIKDAEPPSD